MFKMFGLDRVVSTIAGFGVPGLVLLVAIQVSGWAGAAALTTALAALGGPFGMIGGICLLGVLLLASKAIAKWGFDTVFMAVLARLRAEGLSDETIRTKVESMPVSQSLKLRTVERLCALGGDDSDLGASVT